MIDLNIHDVTNVTLEASYLSNGKSLMLAIERGAGMQRLCVTMYGLTDAQIESFISAFGMPKHIYHDSPTRRLIDESIRRGIEAETDQQPVTTTREPAIVPA
jgi:hypothetical protein